MEIEPEGRQMDVGRIPQADDDFARGGVFPGWSRERVEERFRGRRNTGGAWGPGEFGGREGTLTAASLPAMTTPTPAHSTWRDLIAQQA